MAIVQNLRNIEEFNRETGNWGARTRRQMISAQTRAGIQWYSDKLSQVGVSFKKYFGEINLIQFFFMQYGVYAEAGAGRGYGGSKGGSWIGKDGKRVHTNPASLGKMGTGARKAKPWFNPTIDWEISTLALIVADNKAEQTADTLYNQLKIKHF